jgi:anti-sigma factor (TIGR02949 family)
MSDETRINCTEAAEMLADYLKTELTPENAERVRRHQARCGHCFQTAELERRFRELLEQRAASVRCPEAARARILAALAAARGDG